MIETRSLGGISGSPVWFDPNTRHGRIGRSWGPAVTTNTQSGKTSEPTVIVPYRFVGMVIGTWSTDAQRDFVQRKRGRQIDADWNTGISVVIPDSRIMEFLMSPALRQQRIEAITEKEKRSGVRFTSASAEGAPPSSKTSPDENPDHLADLRRKYGDAVRVERASVANMDGGDVYVGDRHIGWFGGI